MKRKKLIVKIIEGQLKILPMTFLILEFAMLFTLSRIIFIYIQYSFKSIFINFWIICLMLWRVYEFKYSK